MDENEEQKIRMLNQMLVEKKQEKSECRIKLETIQNELKEIDLAIAIFQNELNKLTGNHLIEVRQVIKGSAIGDEAIIALQRLGGTAHYIEVKKEIEKTHLINGVNEKSKSDSVWTYLSKNENVIKQGRGIFKLKS